jgi:DNA-binding protein H-NS
MTTTYRYSSARQMTSYESVTAWRDKRKVMRQEFEARQQAANDAFTSAWNNQADGLNTIYGQMALDRINAEAKAKSAKAADDAANATTIDTSKADIQDSPFSTDGTAELDSGTEIDLTGGTITLSDGTVLDLQTGMKKVDITA